MNNPIKISQKASAFLIKATDKFEKPIICGYCGKERWYIIRCEHCSKE